MMLRMASPLSNEGAEDAEGSAQSAISAHQRFAPTDEELDFIINYDVKCQMRREAEADRR